MRRLILLHTNDLHSRLEQTPKIAGYIRKVRSETADPVFAIDLGDHMDRMNPTTEGTAGQANASILNASGYDYFVIGNNEGLCFTYEQLDGLLDSNHMFQIICSNLYDRTTGRWPGWLKRFDLVERAGIRIGFMGLTADYDIFYRELGWRATDPLEEARMLLDQHRSEVDLFVILSHLGLPKDRELVKSLKGIDLIIGAHTHHLLLEPEQIGSTYLFGAGKFGTHIGRIELCFDGFGKLAKVVGSCVELAELPSAPDISDLLEGYKQIAARNLSEIAAIVKNKVEHRLGNDSPLGNLLAAGIRRRTGCELSIVNNGQFRRGIDSGDVSREILLEICPSPINLCRVRLHGRSIIQALEESLLVEYQTMPIKGFGFRGDVLGGLSVDGADIVYDEGGADYQKIRSVTVQGEPLELDREYEVGTLDMFTFGVGYHSLRLGRDIRYELPDFIRDVLAEQLSDEMAIEEARRKRWNPAGDLH